MRYETQIYYSDVKVVPMDRSRDCNVSIVDGSAVMCIWLPLIIVTGNVEFGPEPGTHVNSCFDPH